MACFRVHTDRLRKGMIIKNDVYSRNGAVLIPANTPVTKEIVVLLTKHFISYVMVEYQTAAPSPADIPSPESVPKIKQQQVKEFKRNFQIAENTLSENLIDIVTKEKDLDVPVLLDMLNGIVGKSGNEVNLCDMLFNMKSSAEGLYTHSINVALWGQILAKWMNLKPEIIELVSTAGLLHDIGLLKLTDKAKLPDGFTFHDELNGKYGKHALLGYNLLKEKSIDQQVKQAILTHHERQDGSGFPLKVKEQNINTISRIIAIADTYDTLTMKEEGTASQSSPFLILKYLEDNGYHKYDSNMLMTFISHIANNFIRHNVRLSNNLVGTIVMINKFNLTRPLIQAGSSFIDLAVRKDLTILEIID